MWYVRSHRGGDGRVAKALHANRLLALACRHLRDAGEGEEGNACAGNDLNEKKEEQKGGNVGRNVRHRRVEPQIG